MAYDRFIIGPMSKGQQSNLKPFAIPDDAYESIRNAYIFRGRLHKRFGARVLNQTATNPQLNTRLGMTVGILDGMGKFTGVLPLVGNDMAVGMVISVGDIIYNLSVLGAVATFNFPVGSPLLQVDTTTTTMPATIVVTGVAGDAGDEVRFFPALPVMGLITDDRANINDETTYAFDTRLAYYWNGAAWDRLGTKTWSGGDADFFGGINFQGDASGSRVLYVTNFVDTDDIQVLSGSTWTALAAEYITGKKILTARIIIPFYSRLILFNTVEEVTGGTGKASFPQRARWCQPTTKDAPLGGPTVPGAWLQDAASGKGGYADADTTESIIGAYVLFDRIVIFFERSTKILVYTQNQLQPFIWQDLNNELGAESTFSVIPFDKVLLGIGNVGIHACNGANVERIDQLIPDEVFNIHNGNDGPKRVQGIRDFFNEMVYWSIPAYAPVNSSGFTTKFPQQILAFNYSTGSWSLYDDSITAFGYFQQQGGLTWAAQITPWEDWINPWNSGSQQFAFRSIIAGNQEGFTFLIDPEDVTRNSLSLSITGLNPVTNDATVINHNLGNGEFVYVSNIAGNAVMGNFYNNQIFPVKVVNENVITLLAGSYPDISGIYEGGGTLERVSQIDILTKQYNFYVKDGANMALYKGDFLVDRTPSLYDRTNPDNPIRIPSGQITIDYYASSNSLSLVQQGIITGASLGTNVLDTSAYPSIPFEEGQDRLWHPCYFQGEGECVQLRFYLTNEQMVNQDIVFQNFQLHQFVLYVNKVSRLQ